MTLGVDLGHSTISTFFIDMVDAIIIIIRFRVGKIFMNGGDTDKWGERLESVFKCCL
jgi:hypothetical protein